MDLGHCPACGSRSVRAAKNIPRHLVRLSRGTPCRYCVSCRFRWLSSVTAFSPLFWLSRNILVSAAFLFSLTWLLSEMRDPPGLLRERRMMTAMGGPASFGRGGSSAAGRGYSPAYPGSSLEGSWPVSGRAGGGHSAAPRAGHSGRTFWPAAVKGGSAPGPGLLQLVQELIRHTGRSPRQIASEIDSTSKEELWNRYGSYFSSKDEAAAAYQKFQRHRDDIIR